MTKKKKVTYTLYIENGEGLDAVRNQIVGRRIRIAAIIKGENPAQWARELKVSRQFIDQVIWGWRRTAYVREFIEERLGEKFWDDDPKNRKNDDQMSQSAVGA